MSTPPPIEKDWIVLLKFGQRKHLEALRDEGLLHMNPQTYFARLEADAARTDAFEGTDRIYQPSAIETMTIEGPVDAFGKKMKIVAKAEDFAGPLSISLSTTHSYNVYCMFGLKEPVVSIDARNLAFGDSFILILNTQAFIDRVCAAIEAAGLHCEFRPVEYYDPDAHSGETGPFRKSSAFSYQSEFRLAAFPGRSEAIQLRAGCLSDITTEVLPLVEIDQLLDFSEETARLAGLL